MILFLLDFLKNWGFKIPTVFEYTSTRMAVSACFSLLLTILLGKKFIKKLYELKIGDRVRSEYCERLEQLHQNKKDTPTMGGILILFVLVVNALLFMNLKSIFTLILIATGLLFGGIGAYDDFLKLKYKNTKGLSARKKICFLGGFSLLLGAYLMLPGLTDLPHFGSWFVPPIAKEMTVKENPSIQEQQEGVTSNRNLSSAAHMVVLKAHEYSSRIYVPFFKEPMIYLPAIGMIFLTALVITGSSNAVNLTDGLDGLATGTVMMASLAFALIAFLSNNTDLSSYLNILYIEGSGEVAIFLSAVVGACLGFLWYNGHPAQVFMGDTGSLSLGGILGVSAVLLKREILLVLVGGIFVLEAFSVILQVCSYKLRNKKRIFLCAPLHHHFEYKGWPETKVVIRFWIVGLLLAMLGVSSLKFQ